MKTNLGLFLIIIGFSLLGFSHGEENLSGLCRNNDHHDCTGGAECFGYFCYPWNDDENPLVSRKKKCTTHQDCETEGPDMKCFKANGGKGLCKKSYQDCDNDSECNTQTGKDEYKVLKISKSWFGSRRRGDGGRFELFPDISFYCC